MSGPLGVLDLLADRAIHTRQGLADALGCRPAVVAMELRALHAWGVPVRVVRGRGYQLTAPVPRLAAADIDAALPPPVRDRLRSLAVQPVVASTNTELLGRGVPPAGRADVLLAEFQTGGRGRRGRAWLAPFGCCVLLSIGIGGLPLRPDLSGLTLAVGVALVRSLAILGVAGVTLKWPNDVEVDGAKLAGVLTELRADAGLGAHVVVGIGLNVRLPEPTRQEVAAAGRRVTDLVRLNDTLDLGARPRIAATVIAEVLGAVETYARDGLAAFQAEWKLHDSLAGRAVIVESAGKARPGVAEGIAPDGALLVDFGAGCERVEAGDVSLRLAS